MSTVATTAREDQTTAKLEGERPAYAEAELRLRAGRRCIVTGAVRPKDELIRFAISPDNIVVPDLAGNLPGRGLWVSAEREAVEFAVRKNTFSKAAKAQVKVDPALTDKVAQLLKKRCLDLLGLAKGAGIAILGQTQVEAAIKTRKLALLLIADDAAANGLGKIDAASVETVRSFTRQELGSILGYEQVVYVGMGSHGLTEKLRLELARLEKIAGTHHLFKETDSGKK